MATPTIESSGLLLVDKPAGITSRAARCGRAGSDTPERSTHLPPGFSFSYLVAERA
jgi:hypothetical protein